MERCSDRRLLLLATLCHVARAPCGPTCTGAALRRYATNRGGSFTCGARIEWLRANRGMGEAEACQRIAGTEFPVECGACAPAGAAAAARLVPSFVWAGPGGGKSSGACRTPSGGEGSFDDVYDTSVEACKERCASRLACVAIEHHTYTRAAAGAVALAVRAARAEITSPCHPGPGPDPDLWP